MFRSIALGTLALLSGCASGGPVDLGRDFAMRAGQQVALPDASTLRYAGIGNDSRCPPDVQCIRAGDADVLFDHASANGTPARIVLNTEHRRAAPVGGMRLLLIDLARRGDRPVVTLRLQAGNGAATP